MERSYRTSNGVFMYAFLLALTGLLLGLEAVQRLRADSPAWGIFLSLMAVAWVACGVALLLRWGRLRLTLRSDSLVIAGDGPERRIDWANVERVQEFSGPAYQLGLRGLLPGPYLPHGLLRGETVLQVDARPAMRLRVRKALVDSYAAFRQDVVRSAGRDVLVDLHARWWRLEDPTPDLPAEAVPGRGTRPTRATARRPLPSSEDGALDDPNDADTRDLAAREELMAGLRRVHQGQGRGRAGDDALEDQDDRRLRRSYRDQDEGEYRASDSKG